MSTARQLVGRFQVLKSDFLREKANRDDPRAPFYAAMLVADTYEAYYRLAGSGPVTVESYKSGPITSHMEIMYARRNGWIQDM